ncbi:MAG: protein-export chaperone SecB [Chromatiales bacterium]|nr:protein-export chaperone SecB [Chromatiales bacterium]
MSKDEAADGAENSVAGSVTEFRLQKVYLKDLSFESPDALSALLDSQQPALKIHVAIEHEFKNDDLWEVVLHVNIHAQDPDKTLTYFMVEVQQAGLFLVTGYGGKERLELLRNQCPETLFPFLRETIWTIVSRAGAPGFLIGPVEFAEIYDLVIAKKRAKEVDGTEDLKDIPSAEK